MLIEVENVIAEVPDNALDQWHVGPWKLNDVTSFNLSLEERNPYESTAIADTSILKATVRKTLRNSFEFSKATCFRF